MFLEKSQKELGRPYTDAELYAFAQINSEHCRHKIFNGTFVIDGKAKEKSLFGLIKDTSKPLTFHVSRYNVSSLLFFRKFVDKGLMFEGLDEKGNSVYETSPSKS